jgi:hypothetical protein
MDTSGRVRQILSTRKLTLYQVSQRSAEMFGKSSPYFIPQRLYHELSIGTLSPNIHQLAALSQISNYRLCDWLSVFGFRLDDIPRLQSLCPGRKTVLLDSSVYDENQWIPWFAERVPESPFPAVAPLGQVLRVTAPRRAGELLALNKRRFLYAKVGRDDVFAFPSLAPGSIARIDVRDTPDALSALGYDASKSIFLVESASSLNCGHLRRVDGGRLQLYSQAFPFAQAELILGNRVKVLGVVNAEIRPLSGQSVRRKSPIQSPGPTTANVLALENRAEIQRLLRESRMRVGVSFREASVMSLRISCIFKDRMYFAAPGTLSDYESASSPLRHVQKIISLCAVYCIDFWTFLRTGGIQIDGLGNDAMSDEMVERTGVPRNQFADEVARAKQSGELGQGFLANLIDRWEELPLFIKNVLPVISKLKDISLPDIFYVGGNRNSTHPCLVGAIFVAVNRRIKTPLRSTALTAWEQPLYVVLRRDGSYLCASCELRHGVLTVHPHSEKPQGSMRFRNGVDAEVVGQVTAIVRDLR